MTCENCIHYDICNESADGNIVELMGEPCFSFFELVYCEDCVMHNNCGFEQAQGLKGFCSYGERGAK